ncbi:MAG: hypothetical protein NXI19_02180 [Alphaproteobacteria bacterium]|nr:hypothetical protein [Alphaproteobacteria bacterium]
MTGSTLPTQTEIASSLYGCWRLFLGDETGLQYFRRDLDGLWSALWALVFAVPVYVLKIALDLGGESVTLLGFDGMVIEAEILVLSGVIYALAIYYILPALERESRYFDYMVAYLWVGMAQVYIHTVPSILRAIGVIPDQGASFMAVVLVLAMLWWSWFMTRTALNVNGGQAGIILAGTVIYEFILAISLSRLL